MSVHAVVHIDRVVHRFVNPYWRTAQMVRQCLIMATAASAWHHLDIAERHDVLTRTELHRLGVTQRVIWARVRTGGPWQILLPGVICLHNGEPTRRQKLDAALRYAGSNAVVTGLAAAELHGLRKFPRSDLVHLLIPDESRARSVGFVVIERTTRMPRRQVKNGIPIAEATRCVLDAARRMRDLAAVETLIAEAVQRGVTSPIRLRRELEAGSVRGSALPRRCLSAIMDGARSTAEIRAVELAKRSGLPPMRWNPRLRTSDGIVLPTPDGWLDDACLAWEIDSFEYHLGPADYRRTLERHNAMVAHGIIVVHTFSSQLVTEPDVVLHELRAAYQHAMRRPRPRIVAE